jgi:type IV pilus assembly protein PilX
MPLAKYFTIPSSSYLNTSGSDSFYAQPGAYIQYIGYITGTGGPPQMLYKITAFGYGGNANAFSVVQSEVAVASATQCLAVGSVGGC